MLALGLAVVLASCGTQGPATLDDGEHFGFISEVAEGEIEFLPAELFLGDKAVSEAAADGEPEPGSGVYFRMSEGGTVTMPVRESADVTIIFIDGENLQSTVIDVDTLSGLYDGSVDESLIYAAPSFLPVYIVVEDGVVTSIQEEYLP